MMESVDVVLKWYHQLMPSVSMLQYSWCEGLPNGGVTEGSLETRSDKVLGKFTSGEGEGPCA